MGTRCSPNISQSSKRKVNKKKVKKKTNFGVPKFNDVLQTMT